MICPLCNKETEEIQTLRSWMEFYDGDYLFSLDNLKFEEYVSNHENETVCGDCFHELVVEITSH